MQKTALGFAVIAVLVVAVLGLQLLTLAGRAPVLTATTVTSTATSTTTATRVSTSTVTTSSDDVVLGPRVSPWGVSDAVRGMAYYGVSFNYSVAPFSPYFTNNSGYRYVNIILVANLYNSSGSFLDVAYWGIQPPPGTSGKEILGWPNFGAFYPGIPAGNYLVDVTPLICNSNRTFDPPSCTVAGHNLRAAFIVP